MERHIVKVFGFPVPICFWDFKICRPPSLLPFVEQKNVVDTSKKNAKKIDNPYFPNISP